MENIADKKRFLPHEMLLMTKRTTESFSNKINVNRPRHYQRKSECLDQYLVIIFLTFNPQK